MNWQLAHRVQADGWRDARYANLLPERPAVGGFQEQNIEKTCVVCGARFVTGCRSKTRCFACADVRRERLRKANDARKRAKRAAAKKAKSLDLPVHHLPVPDGGYGTGQEGAE
jgi:hypothetical protein